MKRKLATLLVICSIIIGINTTVAPAAPENSQETSAVYQLQSHGFGS